ncbi:hypothetical protein ACIGHG_23620 [Bacillus sp. NPDC077411]|uniref:hypothetical protein n=1 Tax=Bacillus sp. NPDC077411 TaxID=3363947 RepID=UPI0037C8195B
MTKVDKRAVRIRINNIMDTYCRGCEKNVKNRDLSTCAIECVHGQELNRLGTYLGGKTVEEKSKCYAKTKADWDQICKKAAAMNENGVTYKKIAELFGCNVWTLSKQMSARGYKGKGNKISRI